MQLEFNYRDFDFITVDDKVNLQWERIWGNRGHTLGEGMTSPDQKYFYLNIPKNSSSSIKKALLELNWTFSNITDYHGQNIIVALRDPVDRWISGIVEYLMMYHQNIIDNIVDPNLYDFMPLLGDKLGISLLFDRMTFDDHTERQAVFLHNVNLSNCTWLKVDKEFNSNFSKLLNDIGYSNNFSNYKKENSTENENNSKKRKLKEFIKFVVERDEYKRYNIEQWFWCDSKLIEQVEFYGTR